MHPLQWLRDRDRGLMALHRAARTAIVMPAMFAFGYKVIGNPTVATFAAFGSFAMLLLVDFTGPMRERLQAHAAIPDRVAGWGMASVVALIAVALLWPAPTHDPRSRVIWTGDHLDAVRRMQSALAEPAQAATEQGALIANGIRLRSPAWIRGTWCAAATVDLAVVPPERSLCVAETGRSGGRTPPRPQPT